MKIFYIVLGVLLFIGILNREETWGSLIAFIAVMSLLIAGCIHFDYNLKEDLLKHQSQIIYEDYGYLYTPIELYLMDGEINNLIYLEGSKIKVVE